MNALTPKRLAEIAKDFKLGVEGGAITLPVARLFSEMIEGVVLDTLVQTKARAKERNLGGNDVPQ